MTAAVWMLNWMSAPVSDDNAPVLVTVAEGSTGIQISELLKKENLIRSRWGFRITVGLRRDSQQLKPGVYELRRNMSLVQIIEKLVRGDVAGARITIPEGYTVGQIAQALAENGIVDKKQFLKSALTGGRRFRDVVPIRSGSLEGYLFPDTYLFTRGSEPDAVIRQMLGVFRKRVWEPRLELRMGSSHLPGLSNAASVDWAARENLHSVLTVASLIEREAKVDRDRAFVSSVIYNRLGRGMPLQIDATVQYARGEHTGRLFYRDYLTPSDYNTYLHRGLPPGPIANPGLKSIKAALNPAKSDYLYYVADGNGAHVFSRTGEEHQRAVAAARRARESSQPQ